MTEVFFSDIVVARSQEPKNIKQLAAEIGLIEGEFSQYGKTMAKILMKPVLKRLQSQQNGRYIVVAG